MTADDPRFVDTNVLLAATDKSRDGHAAALSFLEAGLGGEHRLFASGQVFREYLVASTRPVASNGLGLSSAEALENIREFQGFVQRLDENQEVAEQLLGLVGRYQLEGKRIHDANIVATMKAHGLSRLRTNNPDDFASFEGIEVETQRETKLGR